MTPPTDQQLIDFVAREVRLIDQHHFDERLDLFGDDGIYWMPLEEWGHTDTRLNATLMHEHKPLLIIGVERLKETCTFSQKPKSRYHRIPQRPQIDRHDEAANQYVTRMPMHYLEMRDDDQQLYDVWATHMLKLVDGQLKNKPELIDRVNSEAAFGNIWRFM